MTYEEFEEIVRECVGKFSSYTSYYENQDAFYIQDGAIVQKHCSGGANGGNCWGGEAEGFSNDTPPQDFLPLEPILTLVKPEITYLEFRAIEKLITTDSDHDREYYGNYTNYILWKLDIEKLYDKLFS